MTGHGRNTPCTSGGEWIGTRSAIRHRRGTDHAAGHGPAIPQHPALRRAASGSVIGPAVAIAGTVSERPFRSPPRRGRRDARGTRGEAVGTVYRSATRVAALAAEPT